MTLALPSNEKLKWLSSLPITCRSHSGGDSVAAGGTSLRLLILWNIISWLLLLLDSSDSPLGYTTVAVRL